MFVVIFWKSKKYKKVRSAKIRSTFKSQISIKLLETLDKGSCKDYTHDYEQLSIYLQWDESKRISALDIHKHSI